MKLSALQTATIDWFAQTIYPALPGMGKLFSGVMIPVAIKKLNDLIAENREALESTGVLVGDEINADKLLEMFYFPFKQEDKIEIVFAGVKIFLTKTNIEEIINTAKGIGG